MLLLVVFDNFRVALVSIIGIESRVAARPSLAQQIPALVQADLELMHSGALFVVQPDPFGVLRQFVFFLHQLFDMLKKFCIGHGKLCLLIWNLCDPLFNAYYHTNGHIGKVASSFRVFLMSSSTSSLRGGFEVG